MKLNGQPVRKVNEDVLVFPKGDSEIVLKLRAVTSYDEFDKSYPEPQPPMRVGKNQEKIPQYESPVYRKQMADRRRAHTYWLVAKTLSVTEGLEWEKVDLNNHETWLLLVDDLRESGFTEAEIAMIFSKVLEVNSLDSSKIEAARESFLARSRELKQLSSSQEEPISMVSGGAASALA